MVSLRDVASLDPQALNDFVRSDPQAAARMRDRLYNLRVKVARENPDEFIELVLRDEATGKPIHQASVHEDFQRSVTLHDRLLIWAHVEAGKTQNVSIGRALWEIGRNPRIRIVIAAHRAGYADKIVAAIKSYIENPGPYHDVFPNVRKGSTWAMTQFKVMVVGKGEPKDPTVRSTAAGIASLQGGRVDLLIMDDIVTWENSATPEQREKMWAWYHATLVGRLAPNARIICIGNAFHPDDLMHRLAKQVGWHWRKFSVLDRQGRSAWPERWPMARIDRRRQELTPAEFARQMLSIPRDDAESRFKPQWIQRCLARGLNRRPAYALNSIPHGFKIITGVDLGVRTGRKADLTCLFTIAVHPNEDREVLWCESGRWAGPDIVNRIIDTHRRYSSIVYVESVAAQEFIVHFTKKLSAVPVFPFYTGKNKSHPEFGIESIAAEMANEKWIIPSVGDAAVASSDPSEDTGGGLRPATPELAAWVAEMISYDPDEHTGDRLMASWFAREGSRTPAKRKLRTGRLDVLTR